jgi:hypothetical protein
MEFLVQTASRPVRTFLARVVAFVLLSGILHGVTFGAAHSHISASAAFEAAQKVAVIGQTEQAVPDPVNYRTDRQECLVCLFHQQLFNSVVHAPFFVAEQILPAAGSKGDKLHKYSSSFTSAPIARLSGRAPPHA